MRGTVVLVVIFTISTILVWRFSGRIMDFLSVSGVANVVLVATLLIDVLLFAFLYASASSRSKGEQLEKSLIELRARERELAKSQAKLLALDRMKTEFLSVAAHQLRTPLGSMRWTVDMLLAGDLGTVPKSMRTAMVHLGENQQRLVRLVDDLLNVSHIEQGRVKDAPAMIDCGPLVSQVVADQQGEAGKRQVKIELKLPSGAVPLFIDPDRLRDVVMNLVSNAIKYNRLGGRVDVELVARNGRVTIGVADTGMGIPKKAKPHLFTKFFRAENAVKSETEGSGLGLFVVKSYVERAGGKIRFSSIEGKGSVFTVTYPKKKIQ